MRPPGEPAACVLTGGGLFTLLGWAMSRRTDDAGDNWREVSGNLPTDFSFVIDVHAHEPVTVYVVPI